MKFLLVLVGCFLFIGVVLTTGFWLPAPTLSNKLLAYDQFISISLTAITVVLAVIALLMAYLAFEGKNQIIDKAREVAKQEFESLKPQLIQDLKNQTSEQITDYIAQQYDRYSAETVTSVSTSGTGDIPNDVKELKNV
jgi:predicted PurR-regulated permease PerM